MPFILAGGVSPDAETNDAQVVRKTSDNRGWMAPCTTRPQSAFARERALAFDGSVLLGTAGALKKAASQLGDAFFVLYGDSYLDIDFAPVQNQFERSRKLGLMTVFGNHGAWHVSNVLFTHGTIVR